MKWDVNPKQYDTRSNVAAGDYRGVGQAPKVGTLRDSYVEAVPMKSRTKNTPPKQIGVKGLDPKKVG
jgi:hypothetical protein